MYLQLLRQIEEEHQKYDLRLQFPATEQEILLLKKRTREELGYDLDEQYTNFLRIGNGLDWNGFSIYATTIVPIVGYDDRFIDGFVEANLQYWEVEDVRPAIIAFGETGDEHYIFNLKSKMFEEIDTITLEAIETFSSFDEMVYHLLKQSLE